MFYEFLAEHINIFRYLTFRGIMAAVTAFLLALIAGRPVINYLAAMRFGQQVRDDGPSAHLVKTGTPTMGGLFMWGSVLISALLWAAWNPFVLIACLSLVLFGAIGFVDDFAKIKRSNTKGLSSSGKLFWQGISAFVLLVLIYHMRSYHSTVDTVDLTLKSQDGSVLAATNVSVNHDWEWNLLLPSFEQKNQLSFYAGIYNVELGAVSNLAIFSFPAWSGKGEDQEVFSGRVLYDSGNAVNIFVERKESASGIAHNQKTNISVPYKSQLFQAQFVPYYAKVLWYMPLLLAFLFYALIIVGTSNAANLTDGLDGLAAGMGIALFLPFGVFAYLMGNSVSAHYLLLPYIQGAGELSVFVAAVLGGMTGFLWYNIYPADVFMGDTGSLPMGACAAVVAIMLKQELLLPIAGFMFVLETLSVMIQVVSYKCRKKRVFKMAPIHHHFELSGWKENQVVVRFWILGIFFALLALASLKVR